MEKNRIVWIDSLKGFATICVVLGHIADGYLNAKLFPDSQRLLRDLYNGVYIFHMALFFSLSGMTCQISYGAEHDLNGRKRRAQICNLALLYVLYCVLIWASKLLTSAFVNRQVQVTDILLIWAKPLSPYWYFYVLIVFYILFDNKRVRHLHPNGVMAVLFLMSLFSGFVRTDGWFELEHIFRYAFFFFLGLSLANQQFTKLVSPLAAGIAAVVSLAIAGYYWKNESSVSAIPIINTLSATGIVLGWIGLFRSVKLFDRNGLLSFIGRHSLEIYVIHCFLTAGNRVVSAKLGIDHIWASIGLNLVASICGSLVIAALTKKIGIYDLFFRPYALVERRL